jgi:peroxiredoxin
MKKVILFTMVTFIGTLLVVARGPYKPGELAADFSLKDISGNMVSLSDIDDAKGFIVVFSCNTCPVVKNYEERISGLHKEFADKGFPVVAINSNDRNISPGDSFEEMKKHAATKKYDFHYLYDESQQIAKEFGATNTPHVFVLSRDENILRVEYTGAIDNNADNPEAATKKYVADAVNNLLKGDDPSPSETKAVGCGIKWKDMQGKK